MLACVLLCFQCILINLVVVVKARLKYFNKEFMAQFTTEHVKNIGEGSFPAPGGFPDTGNGIYADKLSYEEWLNFNLAIRVHQNFVE